MSGHVDRLESDRNKSKDLRAEAARVSDEVKPLRERLDAMQEKQRQYLENTAKELVRLAPFIKLGEEIIPFLEACVFAWKQPIRANREGSKFLTLEGIAKEAQRLLSIYYERANDE